LVDTTDFAALDYDGLLATLRETHPALRDAGHH
jgi:hypothetical protein